MGLRKISDISNHKSLRTLICDRANVFAVSPAPAGAVRIPESINGFSVASVGCSAFEDSALTAITFPSTVRYIGGWAVSGCKKLKSVTLPGSVVLIGEKAFDGCTALEKVSLSEGLKYIDWNAFDGCVKLAAITLPDSLLAIEEDAFIDCRALKSISVSQAHADRLPRTVCSSSSRICQIAGVMPASPIHSDLFHEEIARRRLLVCRLQEESRPNGCVDVSADA